MGNENYDVIIAGASFAGLAVASALRGKNVLLLDHEPVGEHQTSACGTLVSTLTALGLESSIVQIHDELVVHTPGHTFVYPVAEEPFCTFDYQLLCRLLLEQGDAEFMLASASGLEGNDVKTDKGIFHGEVLVDASGWRAVLGSCLRPNLVSRSRMNFGLETTVSHTDDGLHFWYDPRGLLEQGVTWAFPAQEQTRVGIGSYQGNSHLNQRLQGFLTDFGDEHGGYHGGFFTHALRDPYVEDLFLVGDAAGHCLGFTGEGIRPSLYFGTELGRLLRDVVDGDLSLTKAKRSYRNLVSRHQRAYQALCMAQRYIPRLPLPLVDALLSLTKRPVVFKRVFDRYTRMFSMEAPTGKPGAILDRIST